MENYHVLELIGEGSFGRVYKGRKKFTGQVVAMKFIPKVGRSEKELKNLRREILIMKDLHHPNIIEMLDSFETDKEVVAVTDYAEGELFQILEDDGALPEEQVQSIACQLVSALFYLHAHRILHRDMKPQNILLGKGGVVKLCDFGFARAMSINTLVLTSIKGTPLYMSPELVEEKPYDHTADLWALGCILYELFTGQPPFYTNSIFQLVSLIIKDPVRWPKNMSTSFKDFLQGLLTKSPRHRLSWPYLLEHPFVKDGVVVAEEDKHTQSPFTMNPTASLVIEKEKQIKERAHPAGTSKILGQARAKAEQQDSTKKQKKAKAEAWAKEQKEHVQKQLEDAPAPSDRPMTQEWEKEHALKTSITVKSINTFEKSEDNEAAVEPTPRIDRIGKDFSKEFPSVEVEARKVVKQYPEKKKNIENVKLHEEDVDSDDEWQGLVEATDCAKTEPTEVAAYLGDKAFISKLKSRLQSSSVQVLDGVLEGASRLRPTLRIIINLLTTPECEQEVLINFMKTLNLPCHVMTLIEEILQKAKVKDQAWCQHILIDLVATVNAYLSSDSIDIETPKPNPCEALYTQTCLRFAAVFPKLHSQKMDRDLRLREQSLMCLIYICEVMEKAEGLKMPETVFEGLSQQTALLEVLLTGCILDENVMKRLEACADSNGEIAQQRMEEMICLNVATLAALTHLPIHNIAGTKGKKKLSSSLAEVLCSTKNQNIAHDYLLLLNHPSTCANVVKVLYQCCQQSVALCKHLCTTEKEIEAIVGVLTGKVDLADMELNSVLESCIHLLSVLMIQTESVPEALNDHVSFIITIFLESQLASHTAAAALVFVQLLQYGFSAEVAPEELLSAAQSTFTDLSQICVRCPFDFGVLDGIVLLLCQTVAPGEISVARLFLESGIWDILWHRFAQMLQVKNPDSHLPLYNIEIEDANTDENFTPPDWGLMSMQGLQGALQLAVAVYTKEAYHVVPNFASTDNVTVLCISHMLTKDFLHHVHHSVMYKAKPTSPAVETLESATQLCCFPFAVDTNEELLSNIQTCFAKHQILPKLLHACVTYLKPEDLQLSMGLMSRLVLQDPVFAQQFSDCVLELNFKKKAISFLSRAVDSESGCSLSVLCDAISICSHLARTSEENVQLVIDVFKGQKGDYRLLNLALHHTHSVVKTRTCSMLGNLMKHSNSFYAVLKQRDILIKGLIACLKDEDPHVRKNATYCVGNAAFFSAELYSKLAPSIPLLVALLDDQYPRIRANAASDLGNFCMHSTEMCAALIKAKAVSSVLETACRDSQCIVQECALTALRAMCSQQVCKKELQRLSAIDKLSAMSNDEGQYSARSGRSLALSRSTKSTGRYSVTSIMKHCSKLMRVLSNET